MSRRIRVIVQYDGTNYVGWQVQENARSVQSTLQDALECTLGFRPDVCGCSRTDAGVHANMYVCHISSENVDIPTERLAAALNSHLRGSGIAVVGASDEPSDFHARYSCTAKQYVYKIWNAPYSNPFLEGRALFCPKLIDLEKLSFAEEEFCGKHDFRAFMSKGSKNEENTVRTVKYFKAERNGELITLTVCADGFLYNMVRIMTGTYLKCARENLGKGSIADIIQSRERKNAGDTAPAHGLYLDRVFY